MNRSQHFHDAALIRAIDTEKLTRRPNRILNAIRAQGAVAAAKQMLAKPQVGEGFVNVVVKGRIDLTLEHLIAANPVYHELFTDDEVRIAKARAGL